MASDGCLGCSLVADDDRQDVVGVTGVHLLP
jgi:hypothetical protein